MNNKRTVPQWPSARTTTIADSVMVTTGAMNEQEADSAMVAIRPSVTTNNQLLAFPQWVKAAAPTNQVWSIPATPQEWIFEMELELQVPTVST
jgi:hypothetical protein